MLKLKRVENVLLFLTLLFLPTQLGKHFWPQFSYIYSLKVDYLSPTLYFWDLLVVGLLIAWALQKPYINKIALNLFLLFLFTQVLSFLSASNIGAGLLRFEQYTITGFFGVFLASHPFGDLKKKISLPLALGVISEAIISGAEFIRGSTLGLWILGERTFTISTPGIAKFDFYGHEFLRPYATFPHPNVLAGFTLISICILYQWFKNEQMMTKLAILAGSISIFLSMSRTTILAGFVAAFLLAKEKGRIILIIVTVALFPILFIRFSSILNFDNLTLLRREELINSAWQIFLKSPLYGIGLNNFIPAQAADLVIGPNRFLQPVHNIFLLILSETGIIGLIGLIILIGYPIAKISNFKFQISNLLPWLIILFLGMFDHYFLTLPQGNRLLFLVWGYSLSMALDSSEKQ